MRCMICDAAVDPTKVTFNNRTNKFEPTCDTCLASIKQTGEEMLEGTMPVNDPLEDALVVDMEGMIDGA